jgi:uncharacterized protein
MDMSSTDFLFTPSVQRVLKATLGQPERAFTLQELLESAATGRGSTQLQIERLLHAGVLLEEPRRGRQRSIRANTAHFLYPELASIVRKTFGVREPLLDALEPFREHIVQAFVFGSVAKGTDTAGSDVDLVVVGTAPLMDVSQALQALESTLGRTVHLSLYDPQEWLSLLSSDPVMRQIDQGPKLQLIPDAQTT